MASSREQQRVFDPRGRLRVSRGFYALNRLRRNRSL
jgi:hypothetical protein